MSICHLCGGPVNDHGSSKCSEAPWADTPERTATSGGVAFAKAGTEAYSSLRRAGWADDGELRGGWHRLVW